MTLDDHAASLGYQKVRDNTWIHPRTNKTVQVSGGTITVIEDTSFETMANVVHVLTCSAGKLEEAYLGKVDGDWAFVTEESLQERFMVMLLHSPTSMIATPIKPLKVCYEDYADGDFVRVMAERAVGAHRMRISNCEVFVMPTKQPGLSVICILSLEDGECPFKGVSVTELLEMKTEDPNAIEFISVLKGVLAEGRPQSSNTSEHEEHRLAHQPDEYTSFSDPLLRILSAQPESP